MSRELQLAHERIQDLEALVAGRPLPIRNRPSPLRWILVLAVAAMLGVWIPLSYASSARVPEHTLVLADDAAPVFASHGGHDLALVRGWWPGVEAAPLHVIALDCSDWSVRWVSQGFPATAFDRGALRTDNKGAAFLYTSTGPDQKRQFVLDLDSGTELGSTDVPAKWELEAAVREGPTTAEVRTADKFYSLRANSLRHMVGDDHFDVLVPGIPAGSHLGSITLVKDELVIVANDAIFIVDAHTGQFKRRIDWS